MRFPAIKPAFLLLVVLFNHLACAQPQPQQVVLAGQITRNADWQPQLFLVKPQDYRQVFASYEGTVLDTIPLAPDGAFRYKIPELAEKGLYVLYAQPLESRYPNAIAEPTSAENYIGLLLEPGVSIDLEAEITALSRSYKLKTANAESHLLARLRDCRAPLYREIEQTPPDATDHEWEPEDIPAAQQEVQAALDSFLETTQAALPLFAALRLRVPDNEFRDRPEFFLSLLDRLSNLAPGHPWTTQLAYYLQPERLPVLVGKTMPDFALPTPQGDTLHLADVRAKLLLVDFWASWCAPCRREAREVIRPLYDEFHPKGFNVLGISIDRSREAWVAAIEKDGAIWPNVSDLLGDPSPVRQSLKFEYIPANYLLDADGRLLARNVHGDALKAFVREYLASH